MGSIPRIGRLSVALVGAVAVQAPAFAGITKIGPKTYEAGALRVEGLVGTLEVGVAEGGPIEVVLEGPEDKLDDLRVRVAGDTLLIRREEQEEPLSGWLVLKLFRLREEYPTVTVRVPVGTPLEIDGMIGRVTAADLDAPLTIDGGSLDAAIGDVTEAGINLSGAGGISLGQVARRLAAEISGSGDLAAETAGSAEIHVSGSGDVELGPVAGGLSYALSGSGDAEVAAVDGPVTVAITGSGNVHVHDGRAEPLQVEITGSGDFALDGEAVDPDLTVIGTGTIALRSYTGRLRSNGAGDIRGGR